MLQLVVAIGDNVAVSERVAALRNLTEAAPTTLPVISPRVGRSQLARSMGGGSGHRRSRRSSRISSVSAPRLKRCSLLSRVLAHRHGGTRPAGSARSAVRLEAGPGSVPPSRSTSLRNASSRASRPTQGSASSNSTGCSAPRPGITRSRSGRRSPRLGPEARHHLFRSRRRRSLGRTNVMPETSQSLRSRALARPCAPHLRKPARPAVRCPSAELKVQAHVWVQLVPAHVKHGGRGTHQAAA